MKPCTPELFALGRTVNKLNQRAGGAENAIGKIRERERHLAYSSAGRMRIGIGRMRFRTGLTRRYTNLLHDRHPKKAEECRQQFDLANSQWSGPGRPGSGKRWSRMRYAAEECYNLAEADADPIAQP